MMAPRHGMVRKRQALKRGALRGLTPIAILRQARCANKQDERFLMRSSCGISGGLWRAQLAIRGFIAAALSNAETRLAEILIEHDRISDLAH